MSGNPARTNAYIGMCRLAGQMPDLRRSDPVAHADLRTSMNDYRILLSLAIGQECDRDGFKVQRLDQGTQGLLFGGAA